MVKGFTFGICKAHSIDLGWGQGPIIKVKIIKYQLGNIWRVGKSN